MTKKRLIKRTLVLVPLGFLLVVVARCPMWPFNYYHDYDVLKRAVLEARCNIEQEIVNEDLTLEEINFTVRTPSGWKVNLNFPDDRNMDQLCEQPKGLLFQRPGGHSQLFSLAYLNEVLKKDDVKLLDIKDVLRKFDLIAPILQANYENEEIPRSPAFSRREACKYLWIYDPWKPVTSETPHARTENFTPTSQRSEPGPRGLPLRRVEFDVITLNADGSVKERRAANALCYKEDLGGGVTLDMVQIPGSQFLMGTTFEEASHVQAAYVRYRGEEFGGFWREGPPHTVTVPKFYMGAFEISQAQWRAVSALPKVSIDLPSDPSRYKGGDRPVEDISWNEAVEFCERLSLAKGRKYRPPTEAEWEYACRAGTTTQFHFGDSITTEFANYNGVYPYGAVGWGTNPDETTPVGSFGAPNAFGLYDMHGNVGELCIDPWHATYEGAPSDGSAWIVNGESDVHVVRGGAFLTTPVDIRAASRSYHPALLRWYYTGLRIVAVPRIP